MIPGVMNRHVRPFGLKLGALHAAAIYFPLHFIAVWVGLTLLIAPHGVEIGVFWPATGALFAFLLLFPARTWPVLFVSAYASELLAHSLLAPQLPFPLAALMFPVKFTA